MRPIPPASLGKTETLFGYPAYLYMQVDGHDCLVHDAIVINRHGTACIDLDKVLQALPDSTEQRLGRLERQVFGETKP